MKKIFLLLLAVVFSLATEAKDNYGIVSTALGADKFTLIENGKPVKILVSPEDKKGVLIAAENLSKDFGRVCGTRAELTTHNSQLTTQNCIIAGTWDSPYIKQFIKSGKIKASDLKGKTEKYIMTVIPSSSLRGGQEGSEGASLVIAGSDMRGTIYGIYELSEQLGVSPWYDWLDVPVEHHDNLALVKGTYTAGEPAVRYRGIFLNDEAPCLTSWVKNTYGTDYGDHRFYARVFELLLRLRANFMWPAMWNWSFYADDPENSRTASEMGIIMGTSHHEPMARNHEEWVRHRKEYGEWDYVTNQKVLDDFFREGIRRSKDNEDLITIGMRGDGDAAMGAKEGHDDEAVAHDEATIKLLEKIVHNQRQIIAEETGKPAEKRQQVWALYKEVQRYYDKGMKVPDDAIILFSDDNWGDVRRLPQFEGSKGSKGHPGGYGMYYHVDYVGAPRNTKWQNVTPIQHMQDQLKLTYEYGVDRLWVLNVGDLKPQEYPIDLFMDMAWNPTEVQGPRSEAMDYEQQTRTFCAQQFGEDQADEAARILNLYSKYVGRVTPEMLDADTYNLETGEWKQVADEFKCLEADALRQYLSLTANYRDAYQQVILFPVQAVSNLYQMYYAQAMNHKLYSEGNPEANHWADLVERYFRRDAELCNYYNKVMAGGKWDGMMTQKHIGYTSWNDDFPADKMPEVYRFENTEDMQGGYTFTPSDGYISMEAEHYYSLKQPAKGKWTVIPDMGRTLSGIAVQPYTASTEGAAITYRFNISRPLREAQGGSFTLHLITASTLAFKRHEGHRYKVSLDNQEPVEVNFNGELNEDPENIYRITYPTVARRVIEKTISLPVNNSSLTTNHLPKALHTLTIEPLDPGVVLEKIVVDFGGYKPSYLFGNESPCSRNNEDGHALWLRMKPNKEDAMVTAKGVKMTEVVNTAIDELRRYWHGDAVTLKMDKSIAEDGYRIERNQISASTDCGLLYGAYALLRQQETGNKDSKPTTQNSQPRYSIRILDHWDNPNGTCERGFAGHSIFWKKNGEADLNTVKEYGRANASIGINATVLNNVNAKPEMLSRGRLLETKRIADALRPYGIRVYLSVNFASPKALGELSTADPLDKDVIGWWKAKAKEIYKLIPDFGGFLVKANSEGEPGPMDYHRTHVDGANMLADVLEPYNGIVMWRAFVYSATGGDRASQAYEEFMPYDGQFRNNVIIQIKNGPIDFQPREPVSSLFFNLKNTNMMPEFQITQEYTGESIHTCFLAPMWTEFFKTLKSNGIELSSLPAEEGRRGTCISAVANIGDSPDWCGSDMAQANWYAFGRLAWNDELTPEEIAREWLEQTYTRDSAFVNPMTKLLCESREAVVRYMMPLGLHHIFAGGHHYGPEPWYNPDNCREDWKPRYYHKADSIGLGFDRTETGSNNVSQYPEPLRSEYSNIETCPEPLLLWFHHVPWTHRMKSGDTLWDCLCHTYDQGVSEAEGFVSAWRRMKPYVDRQRWEGQLVNFERQAKDAWWWRDGCLLYFQTFSKMPLPADSPAPKHSLTDLQNFHLDMDNYTRADINKLP